MDYYEMRKERGREREKEWEREREKRKSKRKERYAPQARRRKSVQGSERSELT
jgi:hypothetical protein